MRGIGSIFRREMAAYFTTPVASIFLVMFLFLTNFMLWKIASFYDTDNATLGPLFGFFPILFLPLVPALSMRLWAEERRSGTIEFLMTLPITTTQAVVGKFLAAWLFTTIAVVLTATNWLTVSYLGSPDHGVILAGYIGSILMAGAFLAIGGAMSALTKNQVGAFVLAFIVSFAFVLSGFTQVLDLVEGLGVQWLVDAVRRTSFMDHFDGIAKGVIALPDVIYFGSVIVLFLFINVIVIDLKKAG